MILIEVKLRILAIQSLLYRRHGERFHTARPREAARIILRLSGTGTDGATLRLYLERFESDPSRQDLDVQSALAELAAVAVQIAEIERFTGRTQPSIIT